MSMEKIGIFIVAYVLMYLVMKILPIEAKREAYHFWAILFALGIALIF